MGKASVSRGFHRLGLVLSIPLVLLTLGIAGSVVALGNLRDPLDLIGITIACLLGAGAVYVACRAIGWAINGFSSDAG